MKLAYRLAANALFIAIISACAGDDTDPNSDTCKKLRAQYDEAKLLRDQAQGYGPWGDTQVTDVLLTQFVNKHWGCFH